MDRVKEIKRQKVSAEGGQLAGQDFIGFAKTSFNPKHKIDFLDEEGE